LNGLDLFSGIGGITYALQEWVKPVAYCEIETYCQSILLQRMQEGHLPKAPIWDDVRSLKYAFPHGFIDIIYGGFPCQDISIAGARKGLEGERSGLFFEIMRLAKEIKPTYIFLENTKGILSKGGLQVMESIANIGYNARWITKSCREEDSPQHRERWFCLAYSNGKSGTGLPCGKKKGQSQLRMCTQHKKWNQWPENESPLLGVDDVIPFRLDRTKALGNSVCLKQTKEAFKELIGLSKE